MTTYDVTATREGEWWTLEAPAVPGAYGQAATLAALADEYRKKATAARAAAVKGFVESGHLPYREAAQALGMSPQRVHQLATA